LYLHQNITMLHWTLFYLHFELLWMCLMKFEVVVALKMYIVAFWIVTLGGTVGGYKITWCQPRSPQSELIWVSLLYMWTHSSRILCRTCDTLFSTWLYWIWVSIPKIVELVQPEVLGIAACIRSEKNNTNVENLSRCSVVGAWMKHMNESVLSKVKYFFPTLSNC